MNRLLGSTPRRWMAVRWLVGIACVAFVVLIASGCSAISAGVITNKEAEAGYYYTTVICTPVGKVTVCTPYLFWDDPDWRFDIETSDETGWVYVTEEAFGEYEVGDYFDAETLPDHDERADG